MRRIKTWTRLSMAIASGGVVAMLWLGASRADGPGKAVAALPSVDEARERARLLHGTIHDTLQVVHEQFYREDEGLAIPAAALKRVFDSVAERNKVELRWLVVDGRAMNVDHQASDDFEKEAAAALGSGKEEFEREIDGEYRHAGRITLKAECLKCHLPSRMSNKERTAGLVISMPVAKSSTR
jgi:hypothetical protein